MVALVFALAAFPLGAAAIDQFPDVPDSNIFHNDINAIAAAGVTTGCGGGNYCPSAFVTREQMAAFMNRLGALGSDKTPVANATTVDRYDANALNRVAYTSTANLAAVGGDGSLTVDITAPGRGYLLIWGFAELYNQNAGQSFSGANCELQVDNTLVPGTYHWIDVVYDDSPIINLDEQACSPSGGYQVCGGTYTVELYVDVSVDVLANDATIMVEYVPFNGTGGIPSIFSCLIIVLAPNDRAVKAD